MKKVLFMTNVPSPYRVNFFNEFGKKVELTVLFETKTFEQGRQFNPSTEGVQNFKAVFLSEEQDGPTFMRRLNKKIFGYLKKDSYDEIIVTNYSYATEMAAIIRMKFKGIPYYLETDGGMAKKENFLKRALKRFLISGATGYFSPSAQSDDYLAFYGAKRDKIYRYPFTSLSEKDILSAVPNQAEKTAYREELGITEERIILSVGQFIHRKGYDVLLNACKDLPADTGVYIVGGEATEEYLRLKEQLNLKNVHFVGFQKSETVAKYYKAANLFVLPTREDIWGLVINEAMAYGLPVITTDKCIAGLALVKEGENGHIVPTEDIEALRRAMDKVLRNENLLKMGEKSLEIIKEYTFENMAAAHLKVFKS